MARRPDRSELEHTREVQETLFRILEILVEPGELGTQLSQVHAELYRVLDADNLYVAVWDEPSGLYFFPYNADPDDQDFAPQALRKSLTDYVRRTGEALLCDQETHQRLREAGEVEFVGQPAPVWLGAPLRTARGSIGAVVLQSYVDPDAYSARDVETLQWVARAMAHPIARAWREEAERAAHDQRLQQLARSRDEAVRASHEKSRFLANMSHELRTPLNAIQGYADLIAEELEARGDETLRADLGAIQRASRHLRELIDGILDLTQVESGRMEVHPSDFTVASLLDQVEEQVAPLVADGGNLWVRVGDPDAGAVHTDRRILFQVLLNLVANACKFTRDGRVVVRSRRRTSPGPEALEIEVSDTGIGIDGKLMEHLFEPFTQGDESSTRRHGGSGLGLAIASRLVQRLGGTLTAASVPGRGSTFTVRVPASIA